MQSGTACNIVWIKAMYTRLIIISTVSLRNVKYLVFFRQPFVLCEIMYIRVQVNNIAKRQLVQIEDDKEITTANNENENIFPIY